MMSIEAIRHESDRAARRAAREHKVPYVPFDADEVDRWDGGGAPIPFLGSYVPKGWTMVDEWFVDSSGFGSPGEPAMTQGRFIDQVKANLRAGHDCGYAVTQAGQFQVYVGVFKRRVKGGK